ncbi:flagellin [Stenotrophomonas maltophilia]|nr:flagellin [Stenotrophomonas maltophilia]MBH1844961.1 flagellin [Stenotrophomonas maltophilia]
MAQIINTNTMSLNAQRNLSTSSSSLATSIQRLSSGMRINSAKDDAAGLAISERFTTQIRGINQAARNANDGISLAQTAEGALGEVGNNLQRIRELAVQARSATNSASDRQALNAEVQLLKQEIQRVAEQTNFNGTSLLDGSFTNQAFQIGADQGQTINISQITNANVHKLGSWTTASRAASLVGATPTGATAAAATPATVGIGTITAGTGGTTTSTLATTFTANNGKSVSINITGTVDNASVTTALQGTFGADGKNEVDGFTLDLGGSATVAAAVTAGTLKVVRTDGSNINVTETATGYTTPASLGFDAVSTDGKVAVAKYDAITADQFTINGQSIEVGAAKDASERATTLVNAINAQTHKTGVTASLIDGKLQLTSPDKDFIVGGTLAGGLAAATGLTTGSTDAASVPPIAGATSFKPGEPATGFAELDISNQANADNAILAMDAALQSVNSARADLGAIQNRFTSTIANLNTNSENLSAARSRIRDVDYAQETAELTRGQILQQAGTAMLAQANQVPQNVLRLLQS